MTVVLALPKLFDDVVTRFAQDAAAQVPPVQPPPQVFGWRAPAQKVVAPGGGTQRRIVWVPGDDGDVGELGAARSPGRNPRPLATLEELFTVLLEAYDAAQPENERAQYIAARLLFDAWYRAVYLAARGTFRIQSVSWVDEKKERRFGATLRVVCTVEAMVPDAPLATAPIDTGASITSSLLTVDDTVQVPPP